MLAWLCANGALWDAMQVAAWGKMLAGYSETMPLTQALRETFDASKPCEMCVGIAKAKNATDKTMPVAEERTAAKFVLAIDSVAPPVFMNDPGKWTTSVQPALPNRTDPVPVPPPRA